MTDPDARIRTLLVQSLDAELGDRLRPDELPVDSLEGPARVASLRR